MFTGDVLYLHVDRGNVLVRGQVAMPVPRIITPKTLREGVSSFYVDFATSSTRSKVRQFKVIPWTMNVDAVYSLAKDYLLGQFLSRSALSRAGPVTKPFIVMSGTVAVWNHARDSMKPKI